MDDLGRSPDGSGYSAEPEPSCTVSAVPVSIPNAWQIMDDWCAKQGKKLLTQSNALIHAGIDLNDREYRRILGRSQAFGMMRSFIHGSRKAIATEAGTAETVQQGSVHEGAGRQASPKTSGPKDS